MPSRDPEWSLAEIVSLTRQVESVLRWIGSETRRLRSLLEDDASFLRRLVQAALIGPPGARADSPPGELETPHTFPSYVFSDEFKRARLVVERELAVRQRALLGLIGTNRWTREVGEWITMLGHLSLDSGKVWTDLAFGLKWKVEALEKGWATHLARIQVYFFVHRPSFGSQPHDGLGSEYQRELRRVREALAALQRLSEQAMAAGRTLETSHRRAEGRLRNALSTLAPPAPPPPLPDGRLCSRHDFLGT